MKYIVIVAGLLVAGLGTYAYSNNCDPYGWAHWQAQHVVGAGLICEDHKFYFNYANVTTYKLVPKADKLPDGRLQ